MLAGATLYGGYQLRHWALAPATAAILSLGFIVAGWHLYARWIPCKLRSLEVRHLADGTAEAARHLIFRRMGGSHYLCLCTRCAGCWTGILLFGGLSVFNKLALHWYLLPQWWTTALLVGSSLTSVPAIHGAIRRWDATTGNESRSAGAHYVLHAPWLLWLSGFLVPLGGFLIYLVLNSQEAANVSVFTKILDVLGVPAGVRRFFDGA